MVDIVLNVVIDECLGYENSRSLSRIIAAGKNSKRVKTEDVGLDSIHLGSFDL